MIEKDTLREAYESGEGTFKKLAEKYGISEGTIKSWAKQDRDKGQPWTKPTQPKPKNQKTKTEKVESKKVEVEKDISWLEIEKEYVTDISRKPCTLESLSEKYGIAIQTIYDYSAAHSWSSQRREYKESTKKKTIEKTIEKVSTEFSDINATIIEALAHGVENGKRALERELTLRTRKVDDGYEVVDTGIVDAGKILNLAIAMKTLQDGVFKGFGKEQELEVERIQIARERLEFEKSKITKDVNAEDKIGELIEALEGVMMDEQ